MAELPGRRRLELVRKPAEVPPFAVRVRAPVRTMGVADVVQAGAALDWAVEFALARAVREPLSLCVLSFVGEPVVGAVTRQRLEQAKVPVLSAQVAPRADGLAPVFERLAALAPTLWLFVGEPAVALLHPSFEVLIGTDRPWSSWLPSLRPRAGHAALELPVPRASLARALAHALPTA